MTRILAMYNLKEGVTFREYRDWSIRVDLPVCRKQKEMRQINVYKAERPDGERVPFEIIELVEVESWDAWTRACGVGEMKNTLDEWGNYADGESLVMVELKDEESL